MKDQGIVLSSMPNIEWAPANLTGHGGTEIGGNWYYTWEQAVAAAKELGDGWRLPTAEEFKALCDLGSTWVEKGPEGVPGRWFGGNHNTDHEGSIFLPAVGFRNYSSGELIAARNCGYYWGGSSSPLPHIYAGTFGFSSTGIIPVAGDYLLFGCGVRMVRNKKRGN